MKTLLTPVLLVIGLMSTGSALADQRIDHFKGKPSASLQEAVINFSATNTELATLLEKESLSANDISTVHQLTYTLENALGKINEELGALAETLELLHLASETVDTKNVKQLGAAYLSTAREMIP